LGAVAGKKKKVGSPMEPLSMMDENKWNISKVNKMENGGEGRLKNSSSIYTTEFLRSRKLKKTGS